MTRGRVLQVLGPSTGGIRRHVTYLRDHLRSTGWDVEVAGPAGSIDGLDHVVAIPRRDRPVGTVRAWAQLRPLVERFDVVHAHGLKPGLLVGAMRARPPAVLSVHNLVLDEVAGRAALPLRWLEGVLPGRVDAVIAVSRGTAERFSGAAASGVLRVIPPAGPPPQPSLSRDAVRAALGIEPGEDLVVTAARLSPQKGLDVLIAAAAQVVGQRPGLRWFVFGEGAEHDDLRRAITHRDLDDVVVLAGPRRSVDDELAAADLVVVTSRWESGPLVLLEAAALGRPIVSTDVGLARSLLDPESGRLVPVGDPTALADAVLAALQDPTGQPPADPSRFAPDRLAEQVADVYRQLLGRNGPSARERAY